MSVRVFILFCVVLGLALLAFGLRYLLPTHAQPLIQLPERVVPPHSSKKGVMDKISEKSSVSISRWREDLKRPSVPVRPHPKKKVSEVELTGIMMENPPQALVNGRFVTVGDKIQGVVVLEIQLDHVTFEYRGRKFKRWLD